MTRSVHVVIVNRNAGDFLRACVASLASSTDVNLAQVTIVDNASTDESLEDLGEAEVRLEVIQNDRNTGFAAACNQGARRCDADYLLFLNPDAQLFPDALATAVQFMERAEAADVGICGAEILDGDGRPTISCARFPTLRIVLGKVTRLDRVLPAVFPSHHLTRAETRDSRCVDQVIGAFFLVRSSLFSRLGGFDDRYFLYFEEVDFALRAREVGAYSYFLKDAVAFHQGQVSSGQDIALRLHHSLRSRQIFAYQHWPRWQAEVLLALTFAVELPARLLDALMMRNWAAIAPTFAGFARLLRDAPGLRAEATTRT